MDPPRKVRGPIKISVFTFGYVVIIRLTIGVTWRRSINLYFRHLSTGMTCRRGVRLCRMRPSSEPQSNSLPNSNLHSKASSRVTRGILRRRTISSYRNVVQATLGLNIPVCSRTRSISCGPWTRYATIPFFRALFTLIMLSSRNRTEAGSQFNCLIT